MTRTLLPTGTAAWAPLAAVCVLVFGAPASAQLTTEAFADEAPSHEELVRLHTAHRLDEDLAAMRMFRPGFAFWQHVFTIPDGSIAYGSARDGRLLAVFPARGDWVAGARWEERALAGTLGGRRLENGVSERREQVAGILEPAVGPVMHNATRGGFLRPNAARYGGFLEEWGLIYERFGVPADIGLAQAIVESGLNPTIRSPARAVGFCQWLEGNWNRMKRHASIVIEGHNQTTQAPYCAAYLSVLAVKYGSFIPALSEHHAGGTNVGRTVINGARLGGSDTREQYFLGAELARDLRTISPVRFREVVRTYGPRSFLYSEMVFGNAYNVLRLRAEIPQAPIHAMRTSRPVSLDEVVRRTGLSPDEVRRYNPALIRQVPANATLYLPFHVEALGRDVTFWHRPADPAFTAVMHDFLLIDRPASDWDDPAFGPVLMAFQRRFRATGSEEGAVMATVLAYVMDEIMTSRRHAILAEFRTSPQVIRLVEEGVQAREAIRSGSAVAR